MRYEATCNIDFRGGRDINSYNRLLNALEAAGWAYCGNSAMVLIEGSEEEVQIALEVLAKALINIGRLQHLTFTVQGVSEPRPAPAAKNHRMALERILSMPWTSQMAAS